jgi:hypothetical protein
VDKLSKTAIDGQEDILNLTKIKDEITSTLPQILLFLYTLFRRYNKVTLTYLYHVEGYLVIFPQFLAFNLLENLES